MDLILPILLSGTAVKPESKGSLIFIFNWNLPIYSPKLSDEKNISPADEVR